jgi:hypothetical protein
MTFIELQISLLVLTLTVLGMAHLLVANEKILSSLDPWRPGQSLFFARPCEEPLERVLGSPATLSPEEPALKQPRARAEKRYSVVILSVKRELRPPLVSALLRLDPMHH